MRLSLGRHVVDDDVCGECDQGDTKARESTSEHGAPGEDGMLAPGFTLCLRVAEELRIVLRGHLGKTKTRGKHGGEYEDTHVGY